MEHPAHLPSSVSTAVRWVLRHGCLTSGTTSCNRRLSALSACAEKCTCAAYDGQIARALNQRRTWRRGATSSEAGEKDTSNGSAIGLQYFECRLKAGKGPSDVRDGLSGTSGRAERNHSTLPDEHALRRLTIDGHDVRDDHVTHEVLCRTCGCYTGIGRELRDIGHILVVLHVVFELDLQDSRRTLLSQ